jgi:hypothetical protein
VGLINRDGLLTNICELSHRSSVVNENMKTYFSLNIAVAVKRARFAAVLSRLPTPAEAYEELFFAFSFININVNPYQFRLGVKNH